jgi:hypothetical protein
VSFWEAVKDAARRTQWLRWRRELATILIGGPVVYLALSRWGSPSGVSDQLITTLVLVAVLALLLPTLEFIWNLVTAPRRALEARVAALERGSDSDAIAVPGFVTSKGRIQPPPQPKLQVLRAIETELRSDSRTIAKAVQEDNPWLLDELETGQTWHHYRDGIAGDATLQNLYEDLREFFEEAGEQDWITVEVTGDPFGDVDREVTWRDTGRRDAAVFQRRFDEAIDLLKPEIRKRSR